MTHTAQTQPRTTRSLSDHAITVAMARVEIALMRSNRDEAIAGIESAFAAEQIDPGGPLGQLDLPARTVNALEARGVRTVRALSAMSATDLLAIPQFGPRTAREIAAALKRVATQLKNYG